jgi:hypothetical protein
MWGKLCGWWFIHYNVQYVMFIALSHTCEKSHILFSKVNMRTRLVQEFQKHPIRGCRCICSIKCTSRYCVTTLSANTSYTSIVSPLKINYESEFRPPYPTTPLAWKKPFGPRRNLNRYAEHFFKWSHSRAFIWSFKIFTSLLNPITHLTISSLKITRETLRLETLRLQVSSRLEQF